MTDGPLVRTDSMAPEPARRLDAVLGSDRAIEPGQVLPLLWHWAYFPDLAGTDGLGADGHPRRDDRWAVTHPRRVAGGGRVRTAGGLRVGEGAERRSELAEVKERSGRSGPVVLCEWQHTYLQGGHPVLEETQTVIYRQASAPGYQAGEAPLPPGPGEREVGRGRLVADHRFDPVLLFRFSAATWNAHRIHYDHRYATEVEGYPGLVVHGPLLAILLAQEAEATIGQLEELTFRYQAPVFDRDRVEFYLERSEPDSCQLQARIGGGGPATTLSARAVGRRRPGVVHHATGRSNG